LNLFPHNTLKEEVAYLPNSFYKNINNESFNEENQMLIITTIIFDN